MNNSDSLERLQKVIAASGICSRRQAEVFITQGRVKVNDKVVTVLGTQVSSQDVVSVNGRVLPNNRRVVYAVNKPKGYICSRRKQSDKDLLVAELAPAQPPVYPIGRLDKESEGLILLTNDGLLTNQLTHPSFEHTKTYRVECRREEKTASREQVRARLLHGVKLGDGKARADALEIKEKSADLWEVTIQVHEGRQHLIRRMCAVVNLEVCRLERVKIGTLSLAGIKRGSYRLLTQAEIHALTA